MNDFHRVLVANRGEIAVRVIRALRMIGMESVAVYSDIDAGAMHVSMADKAFRLPGVSAVETYLDAERIVEIARSAGCDMIHPGYGLLSESGDFSRLCNENGIKFVGPKAETLTICGNKLECKKLVESHGLPVVSYSREPMRDPEEASKFATDVGFPVLVKSAFGGGGRGIREARSKEEVKRAFESSKREAEGSFGRFAVYVEKKLVNPRHLEVQIVASDDSKDFLHVGERECSIQRRYQKLVEISPSPALDDMSRKKLWEYATRIARLVKYSNVGTIEFLRDAEGNFYFLEINSRLQVEHPVTEFVSGIDMVNTQFEIACNNKIPFTQKDVKLSGCAIEFRINAENPCTEFSPTTGKIELVQVPHGPGVRVDTALQEGLTVSPYYDSLVAKLITYGNDFEQARRRAVVALDEFSIFGIETTLPFHRELVRHEQFIRGEIDTTFIEKTGILKRIKRTDENVLNDHHFILAALLLSRDQFSDGKQNKKPERLGFYGKEDGKRKGGRFVDAI
ncbi:MAG: ATP-grasp domain-containing protein [Nitrososphaerota archaeon]|nr:ATP-grasp domain-containing protein [Nitrososphaerota archaeon]